MHEDIKICSYMFGEGLLSAQWMLVKDPWCLISPFCKVALGEPPTPGFHAVVSNLFIIVRTGHGHFALVLPLCSGC